MVLSRVASTPELSWWNATRILDREGRTGKEVPCFVTGSLTRTECMLTDLDCLGVTRALAVSPGAYPAVDGV